MHPYRIYPVSAFFKACWWFRNKLSAFPVYLCDASTTNNRMELTAFIEALRQLKEPCEVRLCSDSQYVINGLEKGWAKGWKRRGWKKSDGSPALNPDLWEQALEQEARHKLTYVWVKGHAGHPENERCDQLAVAQSQAHGGRQGR